MSVRDHLVKAIEDAGSEAKLGEASGYSQHAIWRAKKKGSVTPEMALAIQRATNGRVTARSLCPSVFLVEVPSPERQSA